MTAVVFRGGGSTFTNGAAPIVAEYASRLRLAKLGYTTDIGQLDCVKAECFLIISGHLDELEKKKRKGKK